MRLILSLTFTLFSVFSFSQEWNLQTPIKSIATIKKINAVGNDTFYALNSITSSELLKSTDNGLSWERIRILGNNVIHVMHMFDENNGLLKTSGGFIMTNDGFQTISNLYTTSVSGGSDIFFLDNLTGYIVGNSGQVAKTEDGGYSWDSQTTPVTNLLNAVYFVDENTGFACGNGSTIIKTTDGGLTWTDISTGSANYFDIYFTDTDNGIVIGNYEDLKYTTDGGLTWTDSNYLTTKNLNAITKINDTYIVVGEDGIVLKSTDNGINWTESFVGADDFYGIAFYENTVIVAGKGVLYRSYDYGENWELFQRGIIRSTMNSVHFADNKKGIIAAGPAASGGTSTIHTTDDKGENWARTGFFQGSLIQFSGACLLPDGNGIIGRSSNTISVTNNYGFDWTTKVLPESLSIKTIWMHNASEYLVAGGNKIGYTQNNGTAWTFYNTTNTIVDMHFPTPETGYAITGWIVFKTVDGGQTWEEFSTPPSSGYKTVYFLNENTGFIAGSSSMLRTNDGGLTWIENMNVPNTVKIHFYDEMLGYLVAVNGSVKVTVDGGQNWEYLINGYYTQQTLHDAHFFNGGVMAVGRDSDVFYASISKYITINEEFNIIQICENPANETTHIDLTAYETDIIGSQTGLNITYHLSEDNAHSSINPIENSSLFGMNSNSQTIYVRISSDYDAKIYEVVSLELLRLPQPNPIGELDAIVLGGENGYSVFDLSVYEDYIVGEQDFENPVISYFETIEDAQQDTNPILNPTSFPNILNPQTIYIRISDTTESCYYISSFNIVVDNSLFVDTNKDLQDSIVVYPNPVTDKISIKSAFSQEDILIEIYSVQGKKITFKVYSIDSYTSEIDLSLLSHGVYFMKIVDENRQVIQKIVKY